MKYNPVRAIKPVAIRIPSAQLIGAKYLKTSAYSVEESRTFLREGKHYLISGDIFMTKGVPKLLLRFDSAAHVESSAKCASEVGREMVIRGSGQIIQTTTLAINNRQGEVSSVVVLHKSFVSTRFPTEVDKS
jgi:hypothetical protein